MKTIVAVDEKWGIGKNNGLLFAIPEDMKFFRETTLNKVVVMGSNTLKSFPGGKPLKNRVNIVLWPDADERDDVVIVRNLDETFKNHFRIRHRRRVHYRRSNVLQNHVALLRYGVHHEGQGGRTGAGLF